MGSLALCWVPVGIVCDLLLGRGFDLGVLLQVQRQLVRGLGFRTKAGFAVPVEDYLASSAFSFSI